MDFIGRDMAGGLAELRAGVIGDRRQFLIRIGARKRVHEHQPLRSLNLCSLSQHLKQIVGVGIAGRVRAGYNIFFFRIQECEEATSAFLVQEQ